MKTKRIIRHLFVYDVTVELCVCDDINKARNKPPALRRYMGRAADGAPPAGNCVAKGNRVGIYLDRKDGCNMRVVGHEVHHAAGFVCEWAGVKFDSDESSAHLTGNLLDWVLKQLKKWKIRVK